MICRRCSLSTRRYMFQNNIPKIENSVPNNNKDLASQKCIKLVSRGKNFPTLIKPLLDESEVWHDLNWSLFLKEHLKKVTGLQY